MKRKILSMLLAVNLLTAGLFMTGCGSADSGSGSIGDSGAVTAGTENAGTANAGTAAAGTENGGNYSFNKEYDSDSMVTLSGEKADLLDYEILTTTGVAISVPDAWNNLNNSYGLNYESQDPYCFLISYIPEEHVNNLMALTDDTSDSEMQEVYTAASDALIPVCAFCRVNTEDTDSLAYEQMIAAEFSVTEKLGSIGNDSFYYFAADDTYSQEGLSENDIADLQTLLDSLPEFKDRLVIFPSVESAFDMTSFTALDMDGNTVDASIFADYDVTMVNVWATWCQYCVEEMPSIEAVYENKADNVNIITICQDAADEPELAASELEQVGATFTTLQGNDELEEKVISAIDGFPTTFFVNSRGQVIGSTQVGAPASEDSEIQAAYQELIEEALKEVQ